MIRTACAGVGGAGAFGFGARAMLWFWGDELRCLLERVLEDVLDVLDVLCIAGLF